MRADRLSLGIDALATETSVKFRIYGLVRSCALEYAGGTAHANSDDFSFWVTVVVHSSSSLGGVARVSGGYSRVSGAISAAFTMLRQGKEVIKSLPLHRGR
jgi:hypothetical protein